MGEDAAASGFTASSDALACTLVTRGAVTERARRLGRVGNRMATTGLERGAGASGGVARHRSFREVEPDEVGVGKPIKQSEARTKA